MKSAIFVTLNKDFLDFFYIFLNSLKKNYPDHPELLIYHTDLAAGDVNRLEDLDRVRLFSISENNEHTGPVMAKYHNIDPHVFYTRYLIWKNFADDYDSILHLDLDVLVMKPLNDLIESDEFMIFQDRYDDLDAVFYDNNNLNLKTLLKKDNINMPTSYANAGVFLVPQKYQTAENYDALIDITSRYKDHLIWADQSALNVWLAKEKIDIKNDDQYNYQVFHISRYRSPLSLFKLKDASIIHFNGFFPFRKKLLIMKISYLLTQMPLGMFWLIMFLMIIRFPAYLKIRLDKIILKRKT